LLELTVGSFERLKVELFTLRHGELNIKFLRHPVIVHLTCEDNTQRSRVGQESSALEEVLGFAALGTVHSIDHSVSEPSLKAGIQSDRGSFLSAGGTRSLDHQVSVLLFLVFHSMAHSAFESLFNFKFEYVSGLLSTLGDFLSLLHLVQKMCEVFTRVLLLASLEIFMVATNVSFE
jgi:hypothetical protein